jgi:hypothetical protein
MTERTSTLMPRTNSINGIHTDDSNMLTAWVMLVCSVVKFTRGFRDQVSSSIGFNLKSVYISVCYISVHSRVAWTDTSCP